MEDTCRGAHRVLERRGLTHLQHATRVTCRTARSPGCPGASRRTRAAIAGPAAARRSGRAMRAGPAPAVLRARDYRRRRSSYAREGGNGDTVAVPHRRLSTRGRISGASSASRAIATACIRSRCLNLDRRAASQDLQVIAPRDALVGIAGLQARVEHTCLCTVAVASKQTDCPPHGQGAGLATRSWWKSCYVLVRVGTCFAPGSRAPSRLRRRPGSGE